MHIPDNYLSPSTCAVLTAAMVPAWTHAIRNIKKEITREKMPLLGVGAAFSFLGMMFNIPLPGGTTGHAVGAVLIAILLGPNAACLAVSIALFIQAMLFGDGGILAFGANCVNMAFIMPYLGYGIYNTITKYTKTEKGKLFAAAFAGYIGLNAAALCAAIEFGIQPLLFQDAAGQALYCPYPLTVSIPAMMIGHLTVAGITEAVFTVAIFSYIKRVSPGFLYHHPVSNTGTGKKSIWALLTVLVAAVPLGLLATGTAWGEWGTDEISAVVSGGKVLGYTPSGMQKGFSFEAVFPDYTMNNMPEWLAYVLSAAVGVAIVVILFKLIATRMKPKDKFMEET